ncbi:MAG TPA: hypothetical protein VFP58_12900 [Candidatus Eisenbacteria bacterium]|nr:hypothetical protein [Candidatus Eisenbacteria bacterium]
MPVLFLAGCSSDQGLSNILFAVTSQRLVFVSQRHGPVQAYRIQIDGQDFIQVSHTTGNVYAPQWSPDGNRLAFTSDIGVPSTGTDIFTVSPDGTDQVNLTQTPDVYDSDPSWSPDGRTIAFTSSRDSDYEVYVMNSDGSNPRRLTTRPENDGGARWAPTGDWISFSSSVNDTAELFVMRPDGSDQRRITRSRTADFDPVWSPDGSVIAFWGRGADTTQIYLASPLGTSETPLTNNPNSAREPSWSPDGERIVYSSDDGLHVIRRDGSDDQQIPGTGRRDHTPVWSPDGRWIAFVNNEDPNNFEVFIMRVDGSERQNLSQNYYVDKSPAWEP